jgi:hypothetical protein
MFLGIFVVGDSFLNLESKSAAVVGTFLLDLFNIVVLGNVLKLKLQIGQNFDDGSEIIKPCLV